MLTASIVNDLWGKKVLIVGEPGTKKTTWTGLCMLYWLQQKKCRPHEISVLDFAPKRIQKDEKGIGGSIQDLFATNYIIPPHLALLWAEIHWLKTETIRDKNNPPEFFAPRILAKNATDVLRSCQHNYTSALAQLTAYIEHPTPILIMNDIGIYLHLGSPRLLKQCIKHAETVVMNAYIGRTLVNDYGSNISNRERVLIHHLIRQYLSLNSEDIAPQLNHLVQELGIQYHS